MAGRTWTREEAETARKARIEAAQQVLTDAISGLQSSDDWLRYLELQSKLHNYSAGNVLLITVQHHLAFEEGRVPTSVPSSVASFERWKQLGRQVDKGQRGYAIFAPMRGMRRTATDPAGNTRILRRGDEAAPGEVEARSQVMRGFTVEKVFALEQTSGDPLPEPPRPQLLHGEAPKGLGAAVRTLVEARGYTVDTVPDAAAIGGANGVTSFTDKRVLVRADMDDAAMVKTLIHEAGHVLMHDPAHDELGAKLPRGHQEVEAESVAFIVARVHGMDTGDYTFPYVLTWAADHNAPADDPEKVVAKTAQRVADIARQVIDASPAQHIPGGRAPSPSAERTADRSTEHTQTPEPTPAMSPDTVDVGV